jgi:hypothetical protein
MPAGIGGMTHRQKVEHFIAGLGKQGVGSHTAAPPLFRLLWAIGLEVPPPFFLGFATLTPLMGASFGIVWGACMWLLQWQAWHMPLEWAAVSAAGAGLLFGLGMAGYYRWKAASLRLPPWESYPGPADPQVVDAVSDRRG